MKSLALLTIGALLGLFTQHSNAQNITIPNFSFENNINGDGGGDTTVINNWIENGADYYGTFQTVASEFNSSQYFDGTYYAFTNVGNGNTATLTTAAAVTTIAANTNYTLSVTLGNHNEPDSVPYGQPGTQSFSLLSDGLVIPGETFTLANNALADGVAGRYSISFDTAGLNSGYVGHALSIQLADSDAGIVDANSNPTQVQGSFDNVVLVAPEPSTWTMMFGGMAILGFCVRRKLA